MSLLEVQGLNAGYGGVDVLHDIDLEVDQGELVTVIGANGAGKSTLLRTVSGIVSASSGTVRFDGEDITGEEASAIAARGIGHVPENRRVFPTHPVVANLRLGGWVRRGDKELLAEQLELVYERFPILRERTNQPAGTLSGGQQQMLAIGMALMARPKVLLLDEPSLGLAPLLVREIFEEIKKLKAEGSTILLVEQMANQALKIADRALVLQLGHVRFQGPAAELRESPDVVAAYLG